MSLFDGLQSRDDNPGVAAAIAWRILVDTDERCLSALLGHAHLLPRALPPELVPGVQPASAALLRRCPHCGAALRTHGPLEWVYRDDDRTVESEDGFAGTLDGTCAACGDGTQVRVRLSLAVSRGDNSGELTWHAVEDVHAPA